MKKMLITGLVLIASGMFAQFAVAQINQTIAGPLCIGDTGREDCTPPTPIGTEYVVEFTYEGAGPVQVYLEAAQVAPDHRYFNKVYVDDVEVATLNESYDESDCETYDVIVDVTVDLDPEIAYHELKIVAYFNQSENNRDDIWVRNITLSQPAVPNEDHTWSSLKATYR